MNKENIKEFFDRVSKQIYQNAVNPPPLRFWYNGQLMSSSQFNNIIKNVLNKREKLSKS